MNGPKNNRKSADPNDVRKAGGRFTDGKTRPFHVVNDAEAQDASKASPVPLPSLEHIPPFPVHVLPPVLRAFVLELAEQVQAPVDMPAMIVLAALALVLSKKFSTQVQSGWTEVLGLFVLVAAPSGSLKSVVFSRVLEPILEMERELVAEAAPLRKVEASRARILAARVKNLEGQAAGGKTEDLRAQAERDLEVVRKDLDQVRVRALPKLVTADVTLEKLADLLAEQGGRMGVFAPESQKLLTILAGRYGQGGKPRDTADVDALLNGYSGDDLVIDRVNKGETKVRRATLTLGLMAQPKRLEKLCNIDDGSGLTARFCFCVLPPIDPLKVNYEPPAMSDSTASAYGLLMRQLAGLKHRTNADGSLQETVLFFDDEARRAMVEFRKGLAHRRAKGGDLAQDPRLSEWANKLHGQTARIAQLLHLAWAANEPNPGKVTAESMARGVEVAEYLALHAMRAFDVARVDQALVDAGQVLEWLEAKKLVAFSERDLMRNVIPKHLRRKAQLRPALEHLADHGHIHCTDEKPERVVNRSYLVLHPQKGGRQAPEAPSGQATDKTGASPTSEPSQPVSGSPEAGRQGVKTAENGATTLRGATGGSEPVKPKSPDLSPSRPHSLEGENCEGSPGGGR